MEEERDERAGDKGGDGRSQRGALGAVRVTWSSHQNPGTARAAAHTHAVSLSNSKLGTHGDIRWVDYCMLVYLPKHKPTK